MGGELELGAAAG